MSLISLDDVDVEAATSGELLDPNIKKEVANSFGQYLRSLSEKLMKENPNARLDFDKALRNWKEMPEEEKSEFQLKSKQDRIEMKDQYRNNINRKASNTKALDRERRAREWKDLKLKKENEKYCSEKFRSILARAEEKFENKMEENAELEQEFCDLTAENDELVKRLDKKDNSENSWKLKYKVLFEEHKRCK
eukprot:GFUD01018123.1.p1 GENE.GFUD01018123.1~~GFUD01018123.1.p1  ORF type:complete len:192 (-),score=61.44 GFUD01018123.1:66-641(-)